MNKKVFIFIAIIIIGIYSLWSFNPHINNDNSDIPQMKANPQPDTSKDSKNSNDIVVNTQDNEESYDISDDTNMNVDKDIKSTQDVKADNTNEDTISDVDSNTSNNLTVSSPDQKNFSPKKTVPSPEPLESEIVSRYSARFLSLKNESISKLNTLISQGKAEYQNISDSEKMSAKIKLGLKYLSLGQKLESECDAKFNSILKEMETELKNNDLSTTAVKEAQNQYEAEKKARRSALLKKFKQ